MKITTTLIALILALNAGAQTNKPTFIKGTMDIRFNTRTVAEPTKGVTDLYTLNLNVSDSALFKGTIAFTPYLASFLGAVQSASLNYNIECDVVNPANPSQTKNVGRLYGIVPITPEGVYKFGDGSLRVGVYASGRSQEFESKFTGTAAGKPLVRSEGFLDKLKREAMNISKTVNGKTVTLIVKKYDKMTFTGHVMGQGPVPIYGEATVSGEMVYDYARLAWYFNNLKMSYAQDGQSKVDTLTGSIRWVESPQRKSNGEGEYQFDVRVNEPPPSESSAFSAATDESAFFQTDDTVAGLSGTMKYRDTMKGETVTASVVAVDLKGSKLSRQQTMNLAKLIMISSIIPINAE